LSETAYVIFVAAAESEPHPADVRAFLIPRARAIIIHGHCWHSPPFPQDVRGMEYLLASTDEVEKELQSNISEREYQLTKVVDWSEKYEIYTEALVVDRRRPGVSQPK
jgi:ureidoglycolate hydrolase